MANFNMSTEHLNAGAQSRSYFNSPPGAASAGYSGQKPSPTTLTQIGMQYRTAQQTNPHRPRIRSQYPKNSGLRHVEYILVATFDIDRGSLMEHQYPEAISSDETMLAELMLPDQVHSRAQDWTIFFLHKEPDDTPEAEGADSQADAANASGMSSGKESGNEEEEDDLGTPPLTYVLNHVNTKHDSDVRRGAVVKAMAICTRHSCLDIFKPVLVLAIEEYFRNPTIEFLASLFESLNAMDLSLMPKLSLLERNILQASTSKQMFLEKFQQMIEQEQQDEGKSVTESPKRIGQVIQVDGVRYKLPKDTHEFESKINFLSHSVPVKVPTAQSTETVGNFSIIKLISIFSGPHASSPQPFALHPHLTTNGAYTHPIIVLVNAILTQKRVIFLGHGRPSEEVAEAVLAACALASGGILRGFTRHAFPYTDLTKVDQLIHVPGFIAGVTNPIFASTPGWWDLICDISTGRMKISPKVEAAAMTDGWLSFNQQNPSVLNTAMSSQSTSPPDFTGDVAFMEVVQRSIANRAGEAAVRAMWREWVLKLTRIAAAFEEMVYGASALYIGAEQAKEGAFGMGGHGYVWVDEVSRQRELAGNVSRIEAWRNTRSYYSFKQDLMQMYNSLPIKSIDLFHHHDRLRTLKLTHQDSGAILMGFARVVRTPDEVNQLLTVTSESHGGLFYLSLGLVHPHPEVRFRTAELLERIQRHDAGKHFWSALSKFCRLGYQRVQREREQFRQDAAALDLSPNVGVAATSPAV